MLRNSLYRRPALAALLFSALPLCATPIILDIYSTGQCVGACVDPYYTLIEWPGRTGVPGTLPSYRVTPSQQSGFPYQLWVQDSVAFPTAHWIAPRAQYPDGTLQSSDDAGQYAFQTWFDVSADANPATVILQGSWASDNCTNDISINGAGTGVAMWHDGTCLKRPHHFTIYGAQVFPGYGSVTTDGTNFYGLGQFVTGRNYIEFRAENFSPPSTNNPTGLIVQLSATALPVAVPEPSPAPVALLLLLAALAFLRHRCGFSPA